MSKYDITFGLSQGSYDYNQNTSNELYRRISSAFFKDKLVALGEALGCIPLECFNNIPENYFDLTFNQDSFPEIEHDIVIEYLKQIKRNTKKIFPQH